MKFPNKTTHLLETSLTNLTEATGLKTSWKDPKDQEPDCVVHLERDTKAIELTAVVKSVLQPSHLPQLLELRRKFPHFIVIAGRISRQLAQELKELGINYLDSGGNAFIDTQAFFLFIEGRKAGESVDRKHLFTNASIQLLFHLMVKPGLLTKPYREIASETGASLDNISKTIRSLNENGYIVELKKGGYTFLNKEGLLERWIAEYGERLKPKLLMGRFRFLKDDRWQDLALDPAKTQWSGEPAVDLELGQLRPQLFTLYTLENKQELIRQYRLVPDAQGPVYVYRAFWDLAGYSDTNRVPLLLTYADLLLSGSARNAEAAKSLLDARKEIILQSV
ncbi:MAG TPA: type IV toxin-antitoxin system AbiEi family antitoxin [Flavilitoribacter sp.]|nr:type IV toxin-antitoxin system AbiEi family antitoxin [Flavilitoribacter sp.]